MPDFSAILESCLSKLSLEYDIEVVDNIPRHGKLPKAHIWKIQIPALVSGAAEDVEAYIMFPNDFPYSMPCVIIPDDRFRYMPHISVSTRTLCLYEDSEVYDTENVEGLIRDNLGRARRWIELYYGRDNSGEYIKEIKSYWNEQYDNESLVDDSWILVGKIPNETCEMVGIAYADKTFKNDTHTICVVASDKNNRALEYITYRHKTNEIPVIYIASLMIPTEPPFSMSGQNLLDSIVAENDKRMLKVFLRRNRSANVLFPIGLKYAVGGVHIHNLKINRNGFREGVLSPFKVLTSFENKHKKLDRLYASVYSDLHIAERTAGEMMEERHFLIAGLGSIGSNLCYYLNGYNHATFSLVDRERLSVDNIGRHLLGFEYIGQYKSYAVAHYLQQYRPDREVKAQQHNLQQLKEDEINKSSAIFVCTGDIMSEKWLLSKMVDGSIKKVAFILWLEPYGISGIMLYINPENKESVKLLREKANDSFMNFCLIKREEYTDRENLTQRDMGCNGSYALYSANDVTMFLSAMFPIIERLLEKPSESKCYRWTGNIDIAYKKGISLVTSSEILKNTLQELPV